MQHTGHPLEHLWRKTVIGWATHAIAQRTSHTLKLLWHRMHGIDVPIYIVRTS